METEWNTSSFSCVCVCTRVSLILIFENEKRHVFNSPPRPVTHTPPPIIISLFIIIILVKHNSDEWNIFFLTIVIYFTLEFFYSKNSEKISGRIFNNYRILRKNVYISSNQLLKLIYSQVFSFLLVEKFLRNFRHVNVSSMLVKKLILYYNMFIYFFIKLINSKVETLVYAIHIWNILWDSFQPGRLLTNR